MANNIKKNAKGYGYTYTDLAQIHNFLEEKGWTYYQYTDTDENGTDYIYTVPIIDGKEQPPRRGCRVIQATLSGKNNPAQEQGSGLTYARRYSLLMAFGLATTDDDAQIFNQDDKPSRKSSAREKKTDPPIADKVTQEQIDFIASEMARTGISQEAVLYKVQKEKLGDITQPYYEKLVMWFKAKPDKERKDE